MLLARRTVLAGLVLTGCAAPQAASTVFRFAASDGVPTNANSYGAGSRAVVLVPGGHGVGETWDFQARRMAEIGFRVLAIDYRGRGLSPRVPPNDEKAHLDVLGAVRHLKSEGAEEVSVVGPAGAAGRQAPRRWPLRA